MPLPAEIQKSIDAKNWNKLDDLWTEMLLDESLPVETFIDIAETLKKINEKDHALILLEMLAQHLESLQQYEDALAVYKHMLFFAKHDSDIRPHIINLYKKIYADSEHITDYIETSGLSQDEPILKTLQRLDDFLTYDIGRSFYFERYGIGTVIEVIPSKREIVIDFEKKKRHFLTIDVARGLLKPIDKDHFLYLKSMDIERLRGQLADPVKLVKKILKDLGEPLTAAAIKTHLKGIINDRHISKTWERTRKKLENDADIRIAGHAAKTYSYLKSGTDKKQAVKEDFFKASLQDKYLLAEEFAQTSSSLFTEIADDLVRSANLMYKEHPGLALDIYMLCNDTSITARWQYNTDLLLDQYEAAALLHDMHNTDHQQRVLTRLKDRHGAAWAQEFKKLLFESEQPRLLEEIAAFLSEVPDMLTDIYYMIFSMSKNYPRHYQWMLKKIQSGELSEYLHPSYISKIIDSLNYVKGIKGIVIKILSLDRFDAHIKNAQEDEAKRIFNVIQTNSVLAEYQKRDYMRILEHYFPHFFKKGTESIYSTEESFEKKKAELDHLINVEIPANKKEISRARDFGDLSENFEYKAAKEKQAQLHEKARIIETALAQVTMIKPENIDTSSVTVGCRVTLKEKNSNEKIIYTILGRWDTDLSKNIISHEAPVAHQLLNKKIDEYVVLNQIEYEIVEISNAFK